MDSGFDEEPYEEYTSVDYSLDITIPKLRLTFRSLWLGFIFYFRFSQKEIKRHLFNFMIGIVSCTITVFVAATISTIVDNAPFVILKQAENICGEYDIEITPRNGAYLNYSLIIDTLSKYASNNDIHKLSSSRYAFNGSQSLYFTPDCYDSLNCSNESNHNFISALYDTHDCKLKFWNSQRGKCKPHLSSLWIIDFEKEARMGLGRNWPKELIPKRGEVVINRKQMKAFNVGIGDALLLYIDLDNGNEQTLLRSVLTHTNDTNDFEKYFEHIAHSEFCSRVLFPVTVIGITDQIGFGKFGSKNKFTFVMNAQYFMEFALRFSNANLSRFESLYKTKLNLSQFATNVFFAIPNRIKYYLTLDYAQIQTQFSIYASNIMYYLGFTQIRVSTPIEREFYALRFGALFFELILDIILCVLVTLSVMLLYSLLVISVDTRVKQFSVLRFIGMKRGQLIKLICTQSMCAYSVPSFVIGIVLAQICVVFLLIQFSDLIGYDLEPFISVNGLCRAAFVGLFIPLVSALLPIQNALHSFSSNHSNSNNANNANIIEYKIERSESNESVSRTVLGTGVILVIFGFCIYYLFPLSLITQRLSLLLALFFALMITLLFGLLSLTLNTQLFIEKGLVLLLFAWWDYSHIPYLVYKNMSAHKQRNKKTTLMYALSLGFIIMISVIYRINVNALGLKMLNEYGSKYFVQFSEETDSDSDNSIDHYSELEQRFGNDTIEHMTFKYKPLFKHAKLSASHLSKVYHSPIAVSVISPDYMSVAESSLFRFAQTPKYRIDSELYSAKGSQSALIGHKLKSDLKLTTFDTRIIIEFGHKSHKILRMLPFVEDFPGHLELGKHIWPFSQASLALSIPSALNWAMQMSDSQTNESLEDIKLEIKGSLLKFYANASEANIGKVKEYINEYSRKSFDFDEFNLSVQSTNDIMDLVFSVATYISLFLCLFSLISSMYVNIFEQSKEIAVLRALGLNKFQTYKVYTYEAIVLIFSSCVMGVAIGALVGFTMTAQIALYASYPITFDMPYHLLLIILIASFVSAFLSVLLPLIKLLSNTVSHIMRVNF